MNEKLIQTDRLRHSLDSVQAPKYTHCFKAFRYSICSHFHACFTLQMLICQVFFLVSTIYLHFSPFFGIFCVYRKKTAGKIPPSAQGTPKTEKGENRLSAAKLICCRVFVIVQNLFHIFRTCGILRKRLCDIQDRKIIPHVIFAVNRIFDSVFDVNGIRPNGETAVVSRGRRSDDACRIRNRRVGKGEIAEVFT